MSLPANETTFKSLKVSKTFVPKGQPAITSADYDNNGHFLITTSIDDTIQLYDAVKGKHLKPIYSKKYGCHQAKFTHHQKNCIYSSTKENNIIRYLSLEDNSFIRYFKGHKELVNSLEVSPIHDLFVSSSLDRSMRLWDLRASNCQSFKEMETQVNFLAFDPAGLVICSSSNDGPSPGFELYDMRKLDKPFEQTSFPTGFHSNKVEFSNDTKLLLFSSINGHHLIYDAFESTLLTSLTGVQPLPPSNYPCMGTSTFTPDGKFVLSGSGSGEVLLWDLTEIKTNQPKTYPIKSFIDDSTPRMLLCNPRYSQLASIDTKVNFWLTY